MTRAEGLLDESFIDPPPQGIAHPELLGQAAATGHIAPLTEPEAAVFEQGSGGQVTDGTGVVEAVTPAEPPEAHAPALTPQQLNKVLTAINQDPDVRRLIREARDRRGSSYHSTHTTKSEGQHPRRFSSDAPLPHEKDT
jgi:hypothetical protein